GQSGSFPANFVQSLSLPSLFPHQKAFVALKTFDTKVDGDLVFSKGQVIIAERQVDSNWWYGTCGDLRGIFPVTHVAELEEEIATPPSGDPVEKAEPQLEQIALGQANMDLTAQLDNELSFSRGDFVHIIKILEDGFAFGRSGDRTGSFPLIFVDIIEGSVEAEKPAPEKKHSKNSSYTSDNTRSQDSEVTPYGKTLFPFYAENDNELTFDSNEIVTLVCHVDEQWTEGELDGQRGIFPRSYVEIIVDLEEEELYGRVMYDFQAVSDRDLNLAEGDTVTILSQPDEHWVEAQHDDGRTGLVPMSYIELISEPALPPSPRVAPPAPETPTEEAPVQPPEEPQRRRPVPHRKAPPRPTGKAEEMIKKHKETRQRVISELLSTEKNFLWSLNLFVDCFVSERTEKVSCPLSDDIMDTLFGNVDEVMDVSQRLLNELESATAGKDFDQQLIGPCFLHLKEEMKQVYAPYCRNHDDDFFNRTLDNMRQQGTVFDLGSLLIKPVQRILKYPLLLNELIKSTEDSHDDKRHLLEAVNAMTDVAAAINEFKRRKDLGKYHSDDRESSLSDRFAKLNVHSTMKKFYRLSQKVSGIHTIDEAFNLEERRFRALDHAVRMLVRDISAYVEQMQNCVTGQELLANDIADFYGDKERSQVEQFCKVHNTVAATLLEQFKSSIESCVIVPLNRLLLMFQGPTKVIKKRHDKLLDFDNFNARLKGLRDTEQAAAKHDLQMAKANYEALNAQLMDDLPKLYVLSLDILNDCLNRFLKTEEKFHRAALDQMYHLMQNDVKTEQSDSQRAYLRQKYTPDKLFVAPSAVAPSGQLMDLRLEAGTLVGIIKEGDPMGNKDRWFVDTGASQGFVVKNHFLPASPRSQTSSRNSSICSPGVSSLIEFSPDKDPPPDYASVQHVRLCEQSINQSINEIILVPCFQLYQAIYPFQARNDLELTIAEGDVVLLIQQHDQDGNPDWWMVDLHGKRGYVPATYIFKVQ
ncbi:hypothetical protein CAPTEDRAFT_105924, partial [Capitella teleta]